MKHRCELRLRPACRMLAVTTSAIIALSLFPIDLRAQDYPNRTVKIVVPFPAGGTADVMPRIVADWLSRKWGQSVIIENKHRRRRQYRRRVRRQRRPRTATRCSPRRRRRW